METVNRLLFNNGDDFTTLFPRVRVSRHASSASRSCSGRVRRVSVIDVLVRDRVVMVWRKDRMGYPTGTIVGFSVEQGIKTLVLSL